MARSILLKSMLGSYLVAALFGVIASLTAGGSSLNFLGTSLVIAGVLTLILIAQVLTTVGNPVLRWVMFICSLSAVLFGACVLLEIWLAPQSVLRSHITTIRTVMVCSLVLSLSFLHIGYIFYWRVGTRNWLSISRWGLLGINLFFLLQFELASIDPEVFELFADLFGPDIYARLIGVLVIFFFCATAALPLGFLVRKTRHQNHDAAAAFNTGVSLPIDCPRCGLHCALKVGHSTCPQCKLAMELKLEEPRCACGYLLYRVEAEQCPECGRAIPDDLRWAAVTPSPAPSG